MAQVYAIDGVEIPASLLRAGQYDGAEGVKGPGHLRVSPLAVPGAGVLVAPGVADVISRYPGSGLEAYTVRETVQQTVPVVATGSGSGRSDLVVARVWDGNLETLTGGQTSGGGFAVIQGVAASVIASPAAALAYCRTLSYPAIPLAGLTIPASTGTVAAGMIRDLRALARPRSARTMDWFSNPSSVTVSGTTKKALTSSTRQVQVPAWATTVRALVHCTDLTFRGDNCIGTLAVQFGATVGPDANFNHNTTAANEERGVVIAGFGASVASLAGTTQSLQVLASTTSTSTSVLATTTSQFMWDVYFTEEAV